MRFRINRSHADKFDQLVYQIVEKQDSTLLENVLQSGISLIACITHYYSDLLFNETFAKDIILEALQKILVEDQTLSPTRIVLNLTHAAVRCLLDDAEIRLPDVTSGGFYTCDISSRLVLEEALHDVLFLLPLHVQSALLYLIFYPEKDHLFKPLYSVVDYFLVLKGLEMLSLHMKGLQKAGRHKYFDFSLPTSQTARLLLVSSIYKLSPVVLILLMQTKNLEIVLQFVKLFGGQTITIPRLSELSSCVEYAAEMAQKVEDGVLIGNKESLTYLATELQNMKDIDYTSLSLNPLLSSFIQNSLHITLENYELYQKKLVASVDTSDSEDILRLYNLFNKEIQTQAYLLLQLTSSIENYPEIKKILHILRSHHNK